MLTELATLQVRDISGVLAARQIGRELATRLALEYQDQVRVATALSEICRSALVAGRVAVIVFGADEADLVLTVTVNGEPPAEGVAAAARLMDKVGVSGQVVRMTKPLPADGPDRPGRRQRGAGRPASPSPRWMSCGGTTRT